jgi:YhcH/YjgK/YiaL family protein
MILDTLENASRYAALHPAFPAMFAFLSRDDVGSLESGKVELDGENLYGVITHQAGKKREEARLETHTRYIDVHYVISGKEAIGWKAASNCEEIEQPYNAERDFMLYSDDPGAWLTLHPGSFAVFFPEDGHAPMVSTGMVHKVVMKIAV